MSKLKLTLACGEYDRTRPLIEGKVEPEGIDLNYIALDPEELFWRMAQNTEFDAAEFSMGAYFILISKGVDRFVGIPVFPSRMFRHSAIFINTESGIEKPEDLKGKKIGVPDYTMTACFWIRGLLQHEYGVKPSDMKWFAGGLNNPGRQQRVKVALPDDVKMEHIGDKRTLNNMLVNGDLDVLIGARQPKAYDEGFSKVVRLWPEYIKTERDYFKKTKVFPIMHLIVIRRDIYEKNPWVALSLYKAFDKAKEMCQSEIFDLSAPTYMVPGIEQLYEEVVEVMGEDYWPYGYEPNKKVLDTFAQYAYEQGMTEDLVDTKKIFAPPTLNLYTI